MTQAFNLSQFANKLNSSGQTDNTGLQNSSVTITAGTGMSGGGAVALGSSVTLTNATGLPVSGITSSTTTALGLGSIELGHATDTTISRSAAGVIAVEGVDVVTTFFTNGCSAITGIFLAITF